VLGMAIYMWIRRYPFRIDSKSLRFSAITGVTQSFNSVGIMASVAYIDVSLAILIIFCFPFWVSIYNHYSGVSRLTPMVSICFIAALIGLGLALGVKLGGLELMGILLAIMGMFSMAVMVLTVSHASAKVGPITANFFMTSWTLFYFLLVALIAPELGLLDPISLPESSRGWIAILGTGISFTLGYVLFFVGAASIGTTRASILSISEPVMIILMAILLVDEWLSPIQWLGMCLIIGSLLVVELQRKVKV
jgi:drug/metabolite transporter (DMT)-like permease